MKIFEENVRELYVHTDKCLFADEQSLVQKYDIGGTNFWPIEDFDMALEISYYLLGLQSDIENRAVSILGTKMKRIIAPEILTQIVAEKLQLSRQEAFKFIKAQSFDIN